VFAGSFAFQARPLLHGKLDLASGRAKELATIVETVSQATWQGVGECVIILYRKIHIEGI
jgi:hypothetical protein